MLRGHEKSRVTREKGGKSVGNGKRSIPPQRKKRIKK